MMDEKYSLNDLHDIALPVAPPLWPPAPEVWLLLIIFSTLLIILLNQWRQAKQRNAYRHAGLLLLGAANTVHDVSVVLKRVALAAFPRERVASLYGEEWADFLKQTYKPRDFALITQAAPDEPVNRKVTRLAAAWIRHHRIPGS